MVSSSQIIPPKRTGHPKLSALPKHELRTAASIDELLDELRGSGDGSNDDTSIVGGSPTRAAGEGH